MRSKVPYAAKLKPDENTEEVPVVLVDDDQKKKKNQKKSSQKKNNINKDQDTLKPSPPELSSMATSAVGGTSIAQETAGATSVTTSGVNKNEKEDKKYDDEYEDLSLLRTYCARAPRGASPTGGKGSSSKVALNAAAANKPWQLVRQWLLTHTDEQIRRASMIIKDDDDGLQNREKTALHYACSNGAPVDVLEIFVKKAPNSLRITDAYGWLPIHYAAARHRYSNAKSDDDGARTTKDSTVKILVEAFPDSRRRTDSMGRTPLHFASACEASSTSRSLIFLLGQTGAASHADSRGKLPLHYACAYGAPPGVAAALYELNPAAIETYDVSGHIPLHYALRNAGRKNSPSNVLLLLKLKRPLVNRLAAAAGGGHHPLRMLADYSYAINKVDDDPKCLATYQCLEFLLEAHPEPTSAFFAAFQSLPDWLYERAVVLPVVKQMLDDKMGRGLPVIARTLDFYILAVTTIGFYINVVDAAELQQTVNVTAASCDRTDGLYSDSDDKVEFKKALALYIGATYFAVRELIHATSLLSIRSLHVWFYNINNPLNALFALLMYYWAIRMQMGSDFFFFGIGTTSSALVVSLRIFTYLASMPFEIAVFMAGAFDAFQRLLLYMIAFGVVRMIYTTFQQSKYCVDLANDGSTLEEQGNLLFNDAGSGDSCSMKDSFLNLYTVLASQGEDAEVRYADLVYIVLVLVMTIVLIPFTKNFIPIVMAALKDVREERAEIVLWSNRLDFAAEVERNADFPLLLGKAFDWLWRNAPWKRKEEEKKKPETAIPKKETK